MAASELLLSVRDYDLAATLDSGQVFRWQRVGGVWHGVLGKHLLQLTPTRDGIHARAAAPLNDWGFLREFLQTDVDLVAILKTFPDDEPMRRAVAARPAASLHRGRGGAAVRRRRRTQGKTARESWLAPPFFWR